MSDSVRPQRRQPTRLPCPWDSPSKNTGVGCHFLLLSPGSWCKRFCLCPPRVYFPVLCKFLWLYCGVNGDFLQEDLCRTQVCCTQSPCPCSSPLLTRTSTGDAQTQFCLSLCGVSGSWCRQGLFEPSEQLASMGFDSKCNFAPPTVLLGLLLCC